MKKCILIIALLLTGLFSYSQNLLGMTESQVRNYLNGSDYSEYTNQNEGTTFKLRREYDNIYYIFDNSTVCNRYVIENKKNSMTDADFFILLSDKLYEYGFRVSPVGNKFKKAAILVLETKDMYALFFPSEPYINSDGEEDYTSAKVVIVFKKRI